MSCRPIALLPLVLISACAAQEDYPSLLPRDAERQSFAEPAPPPVAAAAPDPALDAKIAAAQRVIADVAARADEAIGRAGTAAEAARGKPAGSDAWLAAQVALADLDALRSDRLSALTDLEQLASDRALALAPDYPSLTAAIEAARASADAEAARIAAIQAMLAPA